MNLRRPHVLISTLLGVLLAANGCSGPSQDTPGAGGGSAPNGDKLEIRLISWQGPDSPYHTAYENAIKQYMSANPGVKLEHIFQPLNGGLYDKLLDAQFVSHSAPDAVLLTGELIGKFTDQQYIMPLDAYLNEPTPYSGGKRWIDTYIGGEAAFLQARSANRFNSITFIPVDGGPGLSENRPFYYNKSLLEQAGVSELPETWKQFMDVCRKLKEAGVTPVAADNHRFLNWIHQWTGNQFGENAASRYFKPEYEGIQRLYSAKRTVALATGRIRRTDPYMNAQIDVVKQFSAYWQDGWAGADEQSAQQLFVNGHAAFILDGNWNYKFYKENIRDFAWDVMPFPVITKETSPHAEEGLPKGNGSITAYGWGLNKDLEKNPEKLKAVLDFFHYMTSKQAQDRFVDKAFTTSPIQNVHIPASMKPFLETEAHKLNNPLGNAYFLEADSSVRIAAAQQFYTGQIDKEQFISMLEQSMLAMTRRKVMDQLDENYGLPRKIAVAQQQLARLRAENAPASRLEIPQMSLETFKLQLELYKSVPDSR